MFFKTIFAFSAIAALCVSGCSSKKASHAQQQQQQEEGMKDLGPAPWFSAGAQVYRYRLANGLKLLVLEDHSAPTFAYQTWYNVGSKDEETGLTGLAHLFEHMMFKATKNHPDGELDKLLETAGAEGENAFTNRDYTGYVQEMPIKGKQNNFDLIASLESDRMANLIVDDAVLDKEREVVQNERRFRNENSPDGQMYERVYELAFKHHSYHWPVIGYEPDLVRAKSAECFAFYKRYYAPNNATVAVVGDVDHAEVARKIEKYYGQIPSSNIQRRQVSAEPLQDAEHVETKKLKVAVEKLVVAWHVPEGRNPDFAAIEVIRNFIGVGRSSRLYRKLVDGGIATEVEIDNSEHKDPGLFILFVNLQKGKTAKQALTVVNDEFNKVMAGNVTEDEIKRASALMRFSVFDDLDSNEKKAKFLGYYETVNGDFAKGIQELDAIKKMTKAEVVRVAKKYFPQKQRTVIFGLPDASATKGGAQ